MPHQVIPYNAPPQFSASDPAIVQPWLSTGQFAGFAINAFGPRQMATARHLAIGVGATVSLNDGTTRTVQSVVDAPSGSDISVVTVDADLPAWTPVSAQRVLNPVDAAFIASGLTPGAEVRDAADQLRGWFWGGQRGTLHWTHSNVTYVRQSAERYDVGFDAAAGSFAMTAGDSGGGFYVRDAAGKWSLQGIGVSVLGHNGALTVDGNAASLLTPTVKPSNLVYQSSQMVMPRDWLRSLVPASGDANFDGQVNFNDLITVSQNYGQLGTWSSGDFTGDGVTNFEDLVSLSQNYKGDAAQFAMVRSMLVPEPASLLATLAMASLLRRRRRPVAA